MNIRSNDIEPTTYQDASLMRKYLLGETNEAEERALHTLLAEKPALQKVLAELQNSEKLKQAFLTHEQFSAKEGHDDFMKRINASPSAKRTRRIGWHVWAAAAAVVLTFGASLYFALSDRANQGRTIIEAGQQMAQLTMSNGKTINMNRKEVKMELDGVNVSYQKGVLTYTLAQPEEDAEKTNATQPEQIQKPDEPKTVSNNELIIPNGAENSIRLSDGTVVVLNAGSRLIYPVKFTKKNRVVTLEGEGYFQVKHNPGRPFIVQTKQGNITVLGTTFNVNTYNNQCYTTLVNGRVNFTGTNREEFQLNPGEQTIATASGVTKRTVDVTEYTGWASGEYTFNNRRLDDIMQIIKRWYNVDVYYDNLNLCGIKYSGSLKRNVPINEFLDALELTSQEM